MKNLLRMLASIAVFLFLASAAQAATTTFDLNLNVLDSQYSNLIGIESIIFNGTPTLTLSYENDDVTSTTGTFKESGTGYINLYTVSGSVGQSLGLAEDLTFDFTDLEGTWEYDSATGLTTITFDPNQTIDLKYDGTIYATFTLGDNSTGTVDRSATVSVITQTYYLELTDNSAGLIGGASLFEATIGAFGFNDTYYTMTGNATAVVPVPGSFLLIGSGLVCLVGIRRKA